MMKKLFTSDTGIGFDEEVTKKVSTYDIGFDEKVLVLLKKLSTSNIVKLSSFEFQFDKEIIYTLLNFMDEVMFFWIWRKLKVSISE